MFKKKGNCKTEKELRRESEKDLVLLRAELPIVKYHLGESWSREQCKILYKFPVLLIEEIRQIARNGTSQSLTVQ